MKAMRNVLPPMAGQLIQLIKDSSLVSLVSIQELTFRGMELMSSTYLTFETWITITGLYFVLTFGCALSIERLELRWRRQHA